MHAIFLKVATLSKKLSVITAILISLFFWREVWSVKKNSIKKTLVLSRFFRKRQFKVKLLLVWIGFVYVIVLCVLCLWNLFSCLCPFFNDKLTMSHFLHFSGYRSYGPKTTRTITKTKGQQKTRNNCTKKYSGWCRFDFQQNVSWPFFFLLYLNFLPSIDAIQFVFVYIPLWTEVVQPTLNKHSNLWWTNFVIR